MHTRGMESATISWKGCKMSDMTSRVWLTVYEWFCSTYCVFCCKPWLPSPWTPTTTRPWMMRTSPTCWCSSCCHPTNGTTLTTVQSTPSTSSITRPGSWSIWDCFTNSGGVLTSSTESVSYLHFILLGCCVCKREVIRVKIIDSTFATTKKWHLPVTSLQYDWYKTCGLNSLICN